jgi:hypothetical protein
MEYAKLAATVPAAAPRTQLTPAPQQQEPDLVPRTPEEPGQAHYHHSPSSWRKTALNRLTLHSTRRARGYAAPLVPKPFG